MNQKSHQMQVRSCREYQWGAMNIIHLNVVEHCVGRNWDRVRFMNFDVIDWNVFPIQYRMHFPSRICSWDMGLMSQTLMFVFIVAFALDWWWCVWMRAIAWTFSIFVLHSNIQAQNTRSLLLWNYHNALLPMKPFYILFIMWRIHSIASINIQHHCYRNRMVHGSEKKTIHFIWQM